jgi:hypothetical protein
MRKLLNVLVSVGIRRSGFHNPNKVIVKTCLAISQLNFRHVAAHAVILLNRTSSGGRLTVHGRSCTLKCMARKTFDVICGSIHNQLFVGIVAGDTADARIGSTEALAVGQSVGLEAYVDFATPRAANDLLPTAMSLPTKI